MLVIFWVHAPHIQKLCLQTSRQDIRKVVMSQLHSNRLQRRRGWTNIGEANLATRLLNLKMSLLSSIDLKKNTSVINITWATGFLHHDKHGHGSSIRSSYEHQGLRLCRGCPGSTQGLRSSPSSGDA